MITALFSRRAWRPARETPGEISDVQLCWHYKILPGRPDPGNKKRKVMKLKRIVEVLAAMISSVIVLGTFGLRAQEYSQEKAYQHLRCLAETIGPRPLGSPQEKAALAYFAGKIAEFGGNVEWQSVVGTGEPRGRSALNTSSFNVIGRFPGETPREIIVGAHIDSASPEVPGANDDGSGIAAMLEAARVLSGRPHRSTLVFVAFCGEEAGLVGSKSFVSSHALDNVALMLQLDMTSGDSPLMLWIDTRDRQSPAWLVSASVDVYHALGYRDIDYPTIFQSLNSAVGGAGSDHEPFLEKGIPAIAFVSDIRFPIHTPFDNLESFRPDGLARSGQLIVGLVQKFDAGQPSEKAGHYMLVMAGERPIFVRPSWLAAGIVLSLFVGLAAVMRLYARRRVGVSREEDKRIRKSWPKLLALHLLMLIVTFSSFSLMGFLKGHRLPWVYRPGAYILYAFLFFVLGIWLSLQVLRRWRLRKSAFFYLIRASAYFAVLILCTWAGLGPRLAVFPAAGLLCVSLACLVRPAWIKGILWLIAPVLMFRLLVLPEYYQFIYRGIGSMGLAVVKTPLSFVVLNLVIIFITLLWSHPFLLGLAAVYRSARGDLFGLKVFRRPLVLVPLGALIVGGAFYLVGRPSYASPWVQPIAVTERADVDKGKTWIDYSSGDYLRGVRVDSGGTVEEIRARTCFRKVDEALAMDWLRASGTIEPAEGAGKGLMSAKFDLAFDRLPYSVALVLSSDRPLKVEEANVDYRQGKRAVLVRWLSHPPASLRPELKIRLPEGAKLDAEVSAVFLETPRPVRCEGKDKSFIYRAEVRHRLALLKP
jgi:hypothetical protein